MNTKNSGSKKKICLIVLAAVVAFVVSWVLWPSDDGGRDGGDAVASRKPIASVKSRVTHAQAAQQVPRESATDKDKPDAEPPESEQEPLFEVNGKRFRSLAEAVDAANPGDMITLAGDAQTAVGTDPDLDRHRPGRPRGL